MSKNFQPYDKVIYKSGFLAYPSLYISQTGQTATIAIAPDGNMTKDTSDVKSWTTINAPLNKIKHYTW